MLKRIPIWVVMLLLLLFSLLGWIGVEALMKTHAGLLLEIGKRLFEAIAIASVLGITIDRFLKLEIARDVFLATVGYVLPEELRPEMRWLCQLNVLCTEDTMICTLNSLGDDCIRFQVHRTQVVKNIGRTTYKMPVGLGIDEWFKDEGNATIKKFAILKKGYVWPPEGQPIEQYLAKFEFGLNVSKGISEISLEKDEEVTIISEFEEFYPRNGYFHMHIKYATNGAKVIVKTPDDIGIYVQVMEREGHEPLRSGYDYVCPFTLLPYQRIGVRFWDKKQSKAWMSQAVTT